MIAYSPRLCYTCVIRRVFFFYMEESPMLYDKPWISLEDQADKLISRGLIANKNDLVAKLHSVNYYRLTGYLYPFREGGTDKFIAGTKFEKIWCQYRFDRRLRIIILDAIERIEISIRTQVIYLFTQKYGPFGYTEKKNLPNLTDTQFQSLKKTIVSETSRCRDLKSKTQEDFVIHFFDKYGDKHAALPMWMLGEIFSFGTMHTLFNGTDDDIKKSIAAYYNIPDVVLKSWVSCLHSIRNLCAHHSRLCNRIIGYKPLLPSNATKYPEWHKPIKINNSRIFVVIMICRHLMDVIIPNSKWSIRFEDLIREFPEINLFHYGFPADWMNSPVWDKSI